MTTDITEMAQSLKRRATSANEFGESLYVKADDVLSLVEALEKAQQRIASQREYYEGVIADGGKRIAELDAVLEREREKSRRVMSRITELESRTVKLPPCVDDLHGIGMVMSADAVVEALTSYGIKVEAE